MKTGILLTLTFMALLWLPGCQNDGSPVESTASDALAPLTASQLDDGDGCTRTIGFWKNHAGLGPQDDLISQYLPLWLGRDVSDMVGSIAVKSAPLASALLGMEKWEGPSNGIIKLYAQLLAAKLNILEGADDSDIADVIDDADDFLTYHGWWDWDGLGAEDRQVVLDWHSQLDMYNSGVIGPGHCEDRD
ncbi:MAG: hypothetical protein JSW34_08060 [Candidatus Zixiibacteriota bacterium]|nr:MAG: hypothetical protein JSW34_08060 [candidate division Zixibacteria bacterium]